MDVLASVTRCDPYSWRVITGVTFEEPGLFNSQSGILSGKKEEQYENGELNSLGIGKVFGNFKFLSYDTVVLSK